MSQSTFFHALKVDAERCFGCTHCINVCPTEAIRIDAGLAQIKKDWCIDCGECMKACPANAIYLDQDDFESIFNFKYRVVLLPSVFIGQFSKYIKEEEIFASLNELGFTHVFQVEQTVEQIHSSMLDATKHKTEKPHISPFCPAIVRLIQIKFPALVENFLNIKPPIDASAIFFKKSLMDMGIPADEIGMYYVTPCAAKIAAVKSPVGDEKSLIDGVINMDFLYNKVFHLLKQNPYIQKGNGISIPKLTTKSTLWTLTNGEASNMHGRCLAIDEIHNVIDFLERMETTDEIQNVDFLELRACDQSCAGGVLTTGNRFLTVERLKKRSENRTIKPFIFEDTYSNALNHLKNNIYLDKIPPRNLQTFGSNMGEALERMEQVRKLMCHLPGIDCGACGSPNCQTLAQDIARCEAQLTDCVFIQRMMEKEQRFDSAKSLKKIEKIWGKNRLEKESKNKESENEGQ